MKLDELQLAVMKVLWRLGAATVNQVRDELLKEGRELATTTIGTVLTRLEKKQAVAHRAEGRLYIYSPLITEKETRSSFLSSLIEQFFQGSSTALVNHLVKENEIDQSQLNELKKMLDQKQ
jgi:predicted transcriptional regulator